MRDFVVICGVVGLLHPPAGFDSFNSIRIETTRKCSFNFDFVESCRRVSDILNRDAYLKFGGLKYMYNFDYSERTVIGHQLSSLNFPEVSSQFIVVLIIFSTADYSFGLLFLMSTVRETKNSLKN